MIGEEVEVEGVGVVPVDAASLLKRKGRKVPVVGVHVDEGDRERGEGVGDFSGDGGFSAAGSAGDADDQWFGHARNLCNRW